MARKPNDFILRGNVYHYNIRTPTDILRAFPDEPKFQRRSLGTEDVYEARHLTKLVRKKLEARWSEMLANRGDEIAETLRQERDAAERHGSLPWPSMSEDIGNRLERLADQLGVLDEFHSAPNIERIPQAIRNHPDGPSLLNDLQRAKGHQSWREAGDAVLRQGIVKASTGRSYSSQWSAADAAGVPGPTIVTRDAARQYLKARRDAGASASTLNSIVTCMTLIMKDTFPDDEGRKLLWRGLEVRAKVEKRGKKRLALDGPMLKAILRDQHWSVITATKLACHTGFRVSELYSAAWDLEGLTATVISGKTRNARRSIPIHVDIIEDVERWTTDKSRQVKDTIVTSFSRAKIAVGQPDEITFHSTRHAFSSRLAAQQVPEEIRERLCGHKPRSEQARYTHLTVEDLRGYIERLSWSDVDWDTVARSR